MTNKTIFNCFKVKFWYSKLQQATTAIKTLKSQAWYANFSAWFIKNVLSEKKKINYEIEGILWKIKHKICIYTMS